MSEIERGREAEFDEFAAGYAGGMEDPLKRMLGKDQTNYIAVKAEWLLNDLARHVRAQPRAGRLLDYGCGTALMLDVLRTLGYTGALAGCDVSAGMLDEARSTWSNGPLPELTRIEDGRASLRSASFDVVLASCVFHHIPPGERPGAYADMLRLLKPGGRAYVFEHNPYNPLVQFVVKRLPIDRDAILLRAREVRMGFACAGLEDVRTEYMMFFPPRMRRARKTEGLMRWVPMGGQYVVAGVRPQ